MKEVATITFKDAEDSDETVAIVRNDENRIAFCLSRKSGGDVEVTMNRVDAGRLVEALRKAMS